MSYKRATFFISKENILCVGNYGKTPDTNVITAPDVADDEDYFKLTYNYKEEAEKFIELIEDDCCDLFLMELIEASFKQLKKNDIAYRSNCEDKNLSHLMILKKLNEIK